VPAMRSQAAANVHMLNARDGFNSLRP
jgi:hypothetical protein